ncbi:MAG TPA: arginase family protein [Vicinamibacterales bacterium]
MPRCIITPFMLDRRLPDVERLVVPGSLMNDPTVPAGDLFEIVGGLLVPLAAMVEQVRREGQRPVSIGGDCCQTIGVLAGLRRGGVDPVILWLDAHGDFNTPETSPSGFVGGMPLAMLAGRGDTRLLKAAGLNPVPERDIVLCDARDLDPLERKAVETSQIGHVRSLADVPARIPEGRPLYVHVDLDVIDPSDAPAMLYPVPGGPSAAAVRDLLETLVRTRDVAGASMTLWALDRDADGATARACIDAVTPLLASDAEIRQAG